MANHGYEGEVTLLADSCRPSTGPKCIENCPRCQAHSEQKLNKTPLQNQGGKQHRVYCRTRKCMKIGQGQGENFSVYPTSVV